MEVLLVELLDERSPQSIEVRHAELVCLTEVGKAVLVGDRSKLLVEVLEPFWGLIGDPVGVVETEMVFAFAIASFGPVRLTGQVRGINSEDVEIGMPIEVGVDRTETTGDRLLVFHPR